MEMVFLKSTSPVKKGLESWVVQPGEEKAPQRPCCDLSIYKGGLQERKRKTFIPGPVVTGQSAMV